MAWDDTQAESDNITHTEWNTMVTDVKAQWISGNLLNAISSASISGGSIIGDLHMPYDYNIYKINNDYYAKRTSDGAIISSSTSLEDVLNGVSTDITTAATIGFNGDTTYTFNGGTVMFTDKLVYIDGNYGEFDIDNSDCTVFCWFKNSFSGHLHGGIRNCYVNGDRTNTNQIFANFSGTTAYIEKIHTRNVDGRAVYNMIRISDGGTHSVIRDCFIRASYPIRLMGSADAEASRAVIDHCHLGDTAANNQYAIIGIEQHKCQNVSIINNQFSQNFICYSGSAIGSDSLSDLRIHNNCFASISSATGNPMTESHAIMLSGCTRAHITDNIFKLASPSSTYIRMEGDSSYAGIISDNIFSSKYNKITAIHTYGNIKRLNIEDNKFDLSNTSSGNRFIYHEDPHGFANNWIVSDNQISSPKPQEGTCMTFTDIRNSWIHDNIISTEEDGGQEHQGNVGFSVADYQIDSPVNVICDRHVSTNSARTAVMGETIAAWSDGGAFTVTLPNDHTYEGDRTAISVKNMGSNTVTVAGDGGDTIDGEANYELINKYDYITVISDGTNWYKSSLPAHFSGTAISGAWRAPRYDGPRPTADASNEGLIIVSGASGKQTFVYMCVGNSASGYEWVQLAIST